MLPPPTCTIDPWYGSGCEDGPNVTVPRRPCMATWSTPDAPSAPRSVPSMVTARSPCWENVPWSEASNGTASDRDDEAVVASREAGVPARLAHPDCSGPSAVHTTTASGTATLAITMAPQRPGWAACSSRPVRARRHHTAATTALKQPAVTHNSHADLVSVPVPSPCTSATGQHA